MRAVPLGRSSVHFVPLPVERVRTITLPKPVARAIREVPFVASPDYVVERMLDAARVTAKDTLIDLGCGDGRIVIAAARRGARGIGIDIDPERIDNCNAAAKAAGVERLVAFRQQSLFDADLRDATVVALYLLPWMNAQLRPKLLAELRSGTRIVSHAFGLGDWSPDLTIPIEQERRIHTWTVPAGIAGQWAVAWRSADKRLRHGALTLEQEYQTVVGALRCGLDELPLDKTVLAGTTFTFTLPGPAAPVRFNCLIEPDNRMHGLGHPLSSPTVPLEWRARRM